MSASDFRDTVLEHRREIWLWGMGDRSWQQVAEGLRGRVLRRLPLG
jgi:hypothetical protein